MGKFLKYAPLTILLYVFLVSIGFSAFNESMIVGDLSAIIDPKKDVEITNFYVSSVNSDANVLSASFYKTHTSTVFSMPNSDSSVTYTVEVTNIGNVEVGLFKIDGLPDNIDYNLTYYNIKDKICESNRCKLGITKTFNITFTYKENGYNPNNIDYSLYLTYDFRSYHSVSYSYINNNNYPTEVIDGDDLNITFVDDIPRDITVTPNYIHSYNIPNLVINDVTNDIVITAIDNKYTVIFDKNNENAVGNMSNQVFYHDDYQSLSPVNYTLDDHLFLEWNTKADGTGDSYADQENIINLSNQNNSTVTLYAIWDRVSFHYTGDYIFNGSNYINTNVHLFSSENINKDFEIRFTIKDMSTTQARYATLASNMNESGYPWPGIIFRIPTANTQTFEFISNPGSNSQSYSNTTNYYYSGMKIVIKRSSGIIYYSVDGGNYFMQATNNTNFSDTFDAPVTFGAALDGNLNPFRYFIGTLTDMSVTLSDTGQYNIIYAANGGWGYMETQAVNRGATVEISQCNYGSLRDFDHWNTKADDTGTRYIPGQSVKNLANTAETVTLYAIWREPNTYYVRYHGNGGQGNMEDQRFEYYTGQNLRGNTFTNGNKRFIKWNTNPNGLGTDYYDYAYVLNLTKDEGKIINLYAIWGTSSFSKNESTYFDGNTSLNTGIALFNNENRNKDFTVSFTIESNNATNSLQTIFNSMYEVSPYPGFVFRNSQNRLQLSDGAYYLTYDLGTVNHVVIRRVSGILYVSINGGELQRFSDVSNVNSFDTPATFGSSLQSNNTPWRYFRGTLSNMSVIVH